MTSMLNAANGFEPSVRLVARYSGAKPDAMRETLLSPQLDVAKVDVTGGLFEITCRTRSSAIMILKMFPSLSLAIEQFHVESPTSPVASAIGANVPPTPEQAVA